eukprot:gene12222-16372_t
MEKNGKQEAIKHFLELSHQSLLENNAQDALSMVISAIKLSYGEDAIMGILQNAKETFEQQNIDYSLHAAEKICENLENEQNILSDRGESDILVDAFRDGSSVVCSKCNALIPKDRAEAHSKFWCEYAIKNDDEEES